MFMEPASCNTMKLRKYQCFCWAMARKHCKYSDFCYQRQKIIVNTVAWGFRGAKNIGVYGVVCSESLKKAWKHHLFDDFRPLRDWEKSCRGSNNNNNNHHQRPTTNKQQTTNNQQEEEEAQKCDKKCVVRGLQAEIWKYITLCSAPARTRRAHAQHQHSHYYT